MHVHSRGSKVWNRKRIVVFAMALLVVAPLLLGAGAGAAAMNAVGPRSRGDGGTQAVRQEENTEKGGRMETMPAVRVVIGAVAVLWRNRGTIARTALVLLLTLAPLLI